MKQYKLSAFIKLGAAIRYLLEVRFEVKAGEIVPFGGKYVIRNIDKVLTLIKELDLQAAQGSDQYRQLEQLLGCFHVYSEKSPNINQEQADTLNEVIGKVRMRVYADAEQKSACCLDEGQAAPKVVNRWPQTVTLETLGQIPVKQALGGLSILLGSVSVGLTICYMGIVQWLITIFQIVQTKLQGH